MRKLLVVFAAVLAIGGFVFADDISSTKHNLSTSAPGTNAFRATAGTGADQVCVFCHTPHSADQSKGPLWNRAAASGAGGWTMYNSSTLNMAAGVSAPLGVSNACMSCHDGVTAFDVIVNAPGSGNYTAGGADRGWTFNGGNDTLNSGIASFGNDLRSEHPISFQFVGNTTADPDFNNPSGSKIGALPLYNTGGSSNYTECGTCHNPHDHPIGTFLRISNAASQICTTCHIK
jgi:predicted CXXCH cytochrome family protein